MWCAVPLSSKLRTFSHSLGYNRTVKVPAETLIVLPESAEANGLVAPTLTGMKEPNTNRNSSYRDTLEAHAIIVWADARRAFE